MDADAKLVDFKAMARLPSSSTELDIVSHDLTGMTCTDQARQQSKNFNIWASVLGTVLACSELKF